MASFLYRLIRDERGATRLEYTLISVLAVWAALQAFSVVGEKFPSL